MAFPHIRKFLYQNPTSGNYYEVSLEQQASGAVNGKGLRLGTNKINSDPDHDNTKISFVVLTANLAAVMGTQDGETWRDDTFLATAAIYNASNPAGAGALLSTLLT
jgi:hypothetical protein